MAASTLVRQAQPADFPAIDAMWSLVNRAHVEAHPEQLRLLDSAHLQKHFDDLLATESARVFVAEQDGEIAGFIAVRALEAPPVPALVPRTTAYVDIIAVDERVRSQGLGRLLMTTALDWARSNGIGELELDVFDWNTGAIAFYETLGMRSKTRRMSVRF